MVDIEGHKGGRSGNVVAIGLVRADANVSDAGLRLGHDGSRIFVLGRLESPRHLEFGLLSRSPGYCFIRRLGCNTDFVLYKSRNQEFLHLFAISVNAERMCPAF
jgi:hypothetical protein